MLYQHPATLIFGASWIVSVCAAQACARARARVGWGQVNEIFAADLEELTWAECNTSNHHVQIVTRCVCRPSNPQHRIRLCDFESGNTIADSVQKDSWAGARAVGRQHHAVTLVSGI